jgi:hypothetical protein
MTRDQSIYSSATHEPQCPAIEWFCAVPLANGVLNQQAIPWSETPTVSLTRPTIGLLIVK